MITIHLDERSQQALAAVIDMALRGVGIQAHEPAGVLLHLMAKAKAEADAKIVPMQAAE